LRDSLFEDGIVEYVDRGSRSTYSTIFNIICVTSRAARRAASPTAVDAQAPPIRNFQIGGKLTIQ
jgi:hypothetical protein